jgi:O-antigen ligase
MDYLDVYLSPSMSAPMGPVVMGYQYAHNCFLQLLAETGLVGFIPFLFLLAQIFYRGLCELRRRWNAELFGLLAGLSAYLMHAAFDNPLYNLRLSVFFWILVGFISLHLRDPVALTEEV